MPIAEAAIQDGNQDNRSSNVAWIKENQQLYKDLEKTILEHNKSAGWNYDLKEFEPFNIQYTMKMTTMIGT